MYMPAVIVLIILCLFVFDSYKNWFTRDWAKRRLSLCAIVLLVFIDGLFWSDLYFHRGSPGYWGVGQTVFCQFFGC